MASIDKLENNTIRFNRNKQKEIMLKLSLLGQHQYYLDKRENCKFYDIIIDNENVGGILMDIMKDKIYIDVMMIKEELRNKGYGSKVIKHLKRLKRDIEVMVELKNMKVRRFWDNNGFKQNNNGMLFVGDGYDIEYYYSYQ
jgi:GNAT superfamily N-acetyltransferase